MCRHLAYVGPPVHLGALLVDAPHALVDQARAPRFQMSGNDNPHGYGVAWYPPGEATPARERRTRAMWDDDAVDDLARVGPARVVVAAARLASPGSPVEVSGNAPFVAGRYAWSLNGVVDGWHRGVGDDVRGMISPARAAGIEGITDGEALFALALDRLDAGASPGEAVADVLRTATDRSTGRLNFLLADGGTVAATAWGNSLFVNAGDDAVVIASEPLDDDPGWDRVADHTVVTAAPGSLTQRPL